MTNLDKKLPVTIQPATLAHLPEVHRMMHALAAHEGVELALTPRGLRTLALEAAPVRLLVALLDNSPLRHPVGYALMLPRPEAGTGRAVYGIVQLIVQDPLRGQGVGRALIDAAAELARKEGMAEAFIASVPEMDLHLLAALQVAA